MPHFLRETFSVFKVLDVAASGLGQQEYVTENVIDFTIPASSNPKLSGNRSKRKLYANYSGEIRAKSSKICRQKKPIDATNT